MLCFDRMCKLTGIRGELNRSLLIVFVAMSGFWSSAATFTVTNSNASGIGSLRQAILNANATVGANTISFNIPGPGVQTIRPTNELPWITNTMVIDGYTQPGASLTTTFSDKDAILKIVLKGIWRDQSMP